MKLDINQSLNYVNTGKAAFAFLPALWKGYFLAPITNCDITANDALDLKTFIDTQLHLADPTRRWQHATKIEGVEDQTEAASQQTLPNGRTIFTDRSKPLFTMQFVDGGLGSHIARLSYNGLEEYYRIFPYDANNVLGGAVSEDSDVVMTGMTLENHYTHDYKPATRTTVAEFKTSVQLLAEEMNEKGWYIKANCSLAKRLAVRDVLMTDITPGGAAAGVFEIAYTEGNGDINLLTQLTAAVLADADNFTVKRATTGNAIDFTVAVNTAGTGVKFTLDTGDTDYSATAKARIALKDPAALGVLGLKWFEGRDKNGNYYVEVTMS